LPTFLTFATRYIKGAPLAAAKESATSNAH
jgi:hypothetical protein